MAKEVTGIPDEPYPFGDTRAAVMLRAALDRAGTNPRFSLRRLGVELGYKQATVLSHMANGRIAIPMERVPDLARALDMPVGPFALAVLGQKSAAIAEEIRSYLASDASLDGPFDSFAAELERLVGGPLKGLNDDQKSVLREVVLDVKPLRRWLTPAELPVVMSLRDHRPSISNLGLPSDELNFVTAYLAKSS